MLVTALTACLVTTLSLVALGWLPIASAWVTGAGLLFSVGSAALLRARPLLWFLATACAVCCWAALLAPAAEAVDLGGLSGGLARISFEVGRGGCGETGCWCEAEVRACSELEPGSCVAAGTRLGISSSDELPMGAEVTALAHLKPRAFFLNPSDESRWLDTRPHVQAKLDPGSRPRIDRLSMLDAAIARARAAIRRGLDRSLHAPHAGIARALILGEGSAVQRELNDAIRNAGVSHVLAVSGMHVTLLVGALVIVVRWCWLHTPLALYCEAKRVAAAVGVLLAPLLARLCGASPSAVRAAWTSTLMYLVVACGFRPSALSVSALVVAAYAAVTPRDALHPGFVLSVLATAALLSAPRTHALDLHTAARAHADDDAQIADDELAPSLQHSASAVIVSAQESLRAWLATAPFLLLCFGQTSLVAVLANVALVPLGTALVPLAALQVLQQLVSAPLQLASIIPTAPVFELVSAAFIEASRFCAKLDPGLSLPPVTRVQLCALCAAASVWMFAFSRRVRVVVLALALASGLLSEWSLRHALADDRVRVTFLDVGQGDAALIETRGHTMLIDAGGSVGGGPDPGQLAVLPLLRARRIRALDLVVLTHPHPDHYGGLFAVLAQVPARELWDTGQAEAESPEPNELGAPSPMSVTQLLASARQRGTRVLRPSELCGRTRPLGALAIEVLAPCPEFDLTRNPNDNSFVLRVTHGVRSFLFTGDVEHAAEADLARAGERLRSDVLKVGHHGSRTSSTPALLSAVAPWLAVISVGRGNRFGHPHAEVLDRLAAITHVLRTDLAGGVQVLSDGTHLEVSTALAGKLMQR